MNLNVDEFGGRGVVPVVCGDYVSGTAFFVSPTKLLTAGHVLAEYYLDDKALVAIMVEGEYKKCRVCCHQNIPDVAVLECEEYVCPREFVLPLLVCKFKKDVEGLVVGFPRELGNGEDYFGVTVKDSRQKPNLKGGFDRMVVRTDSFGFNSYDGFSGSPVINSFGMAVGIETDQLYNTLGYVSIGAVRPFVESYLDVPIEENNDFYDTTAYGLRTSYNHIRKHTADMLKTRYNRKVHVENSDVERMICGFCGYGINEEQKEIFKLFVAWHDKLAGKRKQYIDNVEAIKQYLVDGIVTKEVLYNIEGLFYLKGSDLSLHADYKKELRVVYQRMVSWFRSKILFENSRFLHVYGPAGCGKSHLLYHEAEQISTQNHVYMFLGSEFSPMEDPVVTISRIMGWKDSDPLEGLNEELLNNGGKTATFIIDALNEGAGTHFWMDQLPILKHKIEEYSQLKLIVSLRELSMEDNLNDILRNGWEKQILAGFNDRSKAITEYFDKYDIHPDDISPYEKIDEFSNPLFLKIFCETYYSQTEEERTQVLRLPIYKKYLKKRNEEVSHGVDEDPKQNMTTKYILWVGQESIEKYNCEDLPRQKAFLRAKKICPNRTWSKNLLKNCLDANLLREYNTDKGDFVDFEFDSMGDYLKADRFIVKKNTESAKYQQLVNLYNILDKDAKRGRHWQKKYNFIRAVLSEWNPSESIWQQQEFVKGKLTSILLSSVNLRNERDERNTLTSEIIGNIIQQNADDYIEPQLMLENLETYSKGLMLNIHAKLIAMSMAERDLTWTTKVNSLFDGAYYKDLIEPLHPMLNHEVETLLIVETWMLSTSFPYLRAYMIRRVKWLLERNSDKTEWLISQFNAVDDPYILSGLYAAVYGVVVSEDKANFSKKISELIFSCHFEDKNKVPQDLMIRHWTLKILELAYTQDAKNDAWLRAQPPYKMNEDIFKLMKEEKFSDENYFGETYGGQRIYRSLYGWDFSRYIIGTNSNNSSKVFFRNGKAVLLKDIEYAIAYLIKNRFGWNDELGKYDADVPYQTGMENSVERIGKKYQWIGLYRVYAYLCDTCKLKINIWSATEGFAKKNYPWYAPERNYFDPTLTETDHALQWSIENFEIISPMLALEQDGIEWVNDEQQMPELYFIVKDRKGDEWVALHGYNNPNVKDGESERTTFVFQNGMFLKESQYKKLLSWAKEINFYGRWMPEHSGSIEYRWNEFPWADSYLQLEEDDNEPFVEGNCKFWLAYSSQLQEDYKGIEESQQFMASVYMPVSDMMKVMRWHTAERGIIRDTKGNVVAINRDIPDDPLRVLLVRREQLDTYMLKKKYMLFWPLVGEKRYGNLRSSFSILRLTGAAIYRPSQGVDVIQQLRKEPPAPKNERELLTKEDFPEMAQETLDSLNEMDEDSMMRLLSIKTNQKDQ